MSHFNREYKDFPFLPRLGVIALLVLIVLPKKVEVLRRFSSVSFFIYMYIIFTVVFQAKSYYNKHKTEEKDVSIKYYNFDINQSL